MLFLRCKHLLAVFRRKHCGFVFQQIYLLERMTLLENAIDAGKLTEHNKQKLKEKASKLFAKVNISEVLQKKYSSQISGGEAQRAGIVRALMNEPTVVFADEPTGALNSNNSQAVLDVFSEVNREGESSTIYLSSFVCGRVWGVSDRGEYYL